MSYVRMILAMVVAVPVLASETKGREQELASTLFQMLPAGTYSDRVLPTEIVQVAPNGRLSKEQTRAAKEMAKAAANACIVKVKYGDGTARNMSVSNFVKVSAKYRRGVVGEFVLGLAGDQKVIEFPRDSKSKDFTVRVEHVKGPYKGQTFTLHARRLGDDKWEINVLDPKRGGLTPEMCGPLHRVDYMNPDGPDAQAPTVPPEISHHADWMNLENGPDGDRTKAP